MIRTADGLRDELTEHLVHGVQWVATVRNMAAIGVTDFVEVGPGRPHRAREADQPRVERPRPRRGR